MALPASTDPLVNGALLALGALAVVDNIVFHWLLGWHRLNEAWTHEQNFAGEIGLVLLGALMVTVGLIGEGRRRRSTAR